MSVCLLFLGDLIHEFLSHEEAFIDRDGPKQIAARQFFERRHSGSGIERREPFVVKVGALNRLQTLGGRNTDGLTND